MLQRTQFRGGYDSNTRGMIRKGRAALFMLAAMGLAAPLAAQVQTPQLTSVTPSTVVRGTTGNLTLTGTQLRAPMDGVTGCSTSGGAVQTRVRFLNGQGQLVDEVTRAAGTVGDTTIANVPYGLAVTANSATYLIRLAYDALVAGVGLLECAASQTSVNFTVQGPTITTESLPPAFVGEPYGPVQLTAIGLIGTPTWGLYESNLPAGLTLSSTGVISGTPTDAGFFYPSFAVSDPNDGFTFTSLALDVAIRINIQPPTLPNGIVGQLYNQLITAPTAFEVWTEDTLPPGLGIETTYDQVNDVYVFRITGTPTAVGTYNFRLIAQGSAPNEDPTYGFRDYTLVVESGVTVLTTSLPNATWAAPYSTTLQSNRVEPPNWQLVSGSLPPGLTLNPATGLISGTPTQLGVFPFSVQVSVETTFGVLSSPPRALSITVNAQVTLSIVTTALGGGIVGEDYSATLLYALTGPPQQVLWRITSGSLPPGISLNESTGRLAGTAQGSGTFPFAVTARLASGLLETTPRQLAITISNRDLSLLPLTMAAGQAGQAYSQLLSPSGGSGDYVLAVIAGALPPNLSLQTNPFRIAGLPTTPGNYAFTLRLTSGNQILDVRYTIEIRADALRILTQALQDGTVGVAYSQRVEAGGGTAPYTFSLSGGTPPGLTLSSGGQFTGTPQTAGVYNMTITVTDARQGRASRDFALTVRAPLTLGPTPLPPATVTEAYSAQLVAAGGRAPYTISLAGGALPAGLTLGSGGLVSGTPAQEGSFTFTAAVVDANSVRVEQAIAIQVVGILRLSPDSLPEATQLQPYSFALTPSGGVTPYSWSLSGELPAGIQFGGGTFQGTPTAAGAFQVSVTLSDARGRTVTRAYLLTVAARVRITTTSLTAATAGSAYSATLAAEGGRTPYTWSVTGLPAGLALNAAQGAISGTPTVGGTFPLSVRVVDADNIADTATLNLVVNLPATPTLRIVNLPATSPPASQPTFNVMLMESYPLPLDGEVELTFAPDRGPDDPAVQFANGGRRLSYTVAANQTAANFGGASPALQTGTVAGLITLTSRYRAGGADVTPTPPPTQTLRINAAAPVLSRVELTRSATGFELIAFGYSNTRDVLRATIRLTPAGGASLTTSEFTIDLSAAFQSYFNSAASAPFGTQFRLALPFTVSGSQSDIASISISVTNSVGTSNTLSANF